MTKVLQVLPDFPGFSPLTMADKDIHSDDTSLEEWAEMIQAKEMQQSIIRRFLDLERAKRFHNQKGTGEPPFG